MNNSNSYGFVKLCYGVVGSYKDTSKMTTQQVIKEFLRHEGVSSATDSAINNVPLIKIDGFTDAQNQFIQNQHKELLRYARDNYRNKEVTQRRQLYMEKFVLKSERRLTLEERINDMKDFFGLRPDQTFQDLVIEGIDDDDFVEYDEEIEKKYRELEKDN